MFPVLSYLRRVATSYVLVRPEMLAIRDGRAMVRLDRPSSYAVLSDGKWGPTLREIPMFEIVATGASSAEAAISLAKRENDLAEMLKAKDMLYTIAFGPEQEDEVDGVVTRRSRLAVIRGVFRASGRNVLETLKATEREKVTHRRLPPGAIHERR